MDIFQRKRNFYLGGGPPTVPFFVKESVCGKFDDRYGTQGWSTRAIFKALAYKPTVARFYRVRSQVPNEAVFEAYLDLPQTEWVLRLLFKLEQRGNSLFVLDLSLQHRVPTERSMGHEEEIIPDFVSHVQSSSTDEFHALLDELFLLKENRQRKRPVVQQEIKTWAKYLTAMEKITQEKAILFKVKAARQHTQRKRGTYLEYELDVSEWVEALSERVNAILSEQAVLEIDIDDEAGRVDLLGIPELNPNQVAQLDRVLGYYFFQWRVPPTAPKRILKFELEPKYHSPKSQQEARLALEGSLREVGVRFKPTPQGFALERWQDWQSYLAVLQKEVTVWDMPTTPIARLQVQYNLDDPQERLRQLRDLSQVLEQKDAAQDIKIAGDHSLEFSLEVNREPSFPKVQGLWEVIKIEVSGTATAAIVEGKSAPKLIGKAGATVTGNRFLLQGDNRRSLQERYNTLRKENSDFSFPEWNTLRIGYQVGFSYLRNPDQWKSKLKKRVQALHGLKWEGVEVLTQPHTEKELTSICGQVSELEEGLDCKVIRLEVGLQFRQSSSEVCKQDLDASIQRLKQAHNSKVVFADAVAKKHVRVGSLEMQQVQDWQAIRTAISNVCGDAIIVHFPVPNGCTRFEMVFAPKLLEGFLEEKWKQLRGNNLKFLTLSEKIEYEKEIAGKGGHYNGGREIGRLNRLRDGKVRVQLKEEDTETRWPSEGYLLPTFIGDLAQIKRLREAVGLVQQRKNGLPINHNLCNFIFDAKAAKEISLAHDVSSDRDWQLKHRLNEAALNTRQREAVWKVLQAEDLVLVQGPPGTGKTTVIAEIVWQMLQENANQKILIASQSHLAVDNALERLYKKNLIRPLRIAARSGHAIEPEGRLYFQEVIEDWAKASAGSKEETENEKNAVAAWLDRMLKAMVAQPAFAEVQEKWRKHIQNPNPDIKEMMKDIYLQNVNVVAATCLECGQRDFKGRYAESGFDCVIVDEASKATPPEMLVPLVLAKKVVIIGDHKQLPPMIEERQIEEVLRELGEDELADDMEALKTSQFEKLFLDANDSVKVTLNAQYRMHAHIMQVINAFYEDEGGLICGIQEDMDKPDFKLRGSRWHGLHAHPLLSPKDHVIWVEVNTPEIAHSPSFSNDGEVDAIRKVLQYLRKANGYAAYLGACPRDEDKEIGLVSFYGKQVEKLQGLVTEFEAQDMHIRLRTVDKFQGMERNIMIVSTVRSDTQISSRVAEAGPIAAKDIRKNGDIGFAKDFRRVNVAFSRARRLLIIVGNESHFTKDNTMYQNIKATIGRYGSRVDISQL